MEKRYCSHHPWTIHYTVLFFEWHSSNFTNYSRCRFLVFFPFTESLSSCPFSFNFTTCLSSLWPVTLEKLHIRRPMTVTFQLRAARRCEGMSDSLKQRRQRLCNSCPINYALLTPPTSLTILCCYQHTTYTNLTFTASSKGPSSSQRKHQLFLLSYRGKETRKLKLIASFLLHCGFVKLLLCGLWFLSLRKSINLFKNPNPHFGPCIRHYTSTSHINKYVSTELTKIEFLQ